MSRPSLRSRALPGLLAFLAAAPAFARPARAQAPAVLPAGRSAYVVQAGGTWDDERADVLPALSSAAAWRSARWRGVGAELRTELDGMLLPGGNAAARLLAGGRAEASVLGMDAWAGGGAGYAYTPGAPRIVTLLEAGGRRRAKWASFFFSVRQTSVRRAPGVYRDTVLLLDTTAVVDSMHLGDGGTVTGRIQVRAPLAPVRYTDAELGMEMTRGRLRLHAAAGGQLRDQARRPSLWARGGGDVQVSRRTQLHFAAGRTRALPELQPRAGLFASLGLRVTSPPRAAPPPAPALGAPGEAAADFQLLSREGMRTLRIRVPGATRVELMADFTGWEPVALTSAGGDLWETTRPIAPGTYRVNLRVDGGAWSAPPGLLAVRDEFGGSVGLLVIP